MSDTLRDQLLGLGFKPAPKPDKPAAGRPAAGGRHGADRRTPDGRHASGKPAAGKHPGQHRDKSADGKGVPQAAEQRGRQRPQQQRPQHTHAKPARSQGDIDLAKAYAIRAQKEKDERIEAERQKQEAARQRREARAKLAEFVKDKALNTADAAIARHFPYGGKIKRIYVTEDQLKALNAGSLGVLQMEGRYLLVDVAVLAEAETIFAPAVALKVDPNAPAEDDPYADPQYQVPDDLVW